MKHGKKVSSRAKKRALYRHLYDMHSMEHSNVISIWCNSGSPCHKLRTALHRFVVVHEKECLSINIVLHSGVSC